MSTTATKTETPKQLPALIKSLAKLQSVVRRAETTGLGRNSAASESCATGHLKDAYRYLVQVEDEHGTARCAAQADKLTELRQRAVAVGLVTSDAAEYAMEEAAALNELGKGIEQDRAQNDEHYAAKQVFQGDWDEDGTVAAMLPRPLAIALLTARGWRAEEKHVRSLYRRDENRSYTVYHSPDGYTATTDPAEALALSLAAEALRA